MFVYHIRKVGVEDLSEGYIGITNNLKQRWKGHDRETRLERNYHLYNAMRKYDTEKVVIFEGTEEECRVLEHELRPYPGIGWNLAVGGSYNGGCTWLGKKRPEHGLRMQKALLGNLNGNKAVYAGGFIFSSRKLASNILKVDYKTIYNRMKNDKFKDYAFLPVEVNELQ